MYNIERKIRVVFAILVSKHIRCNSVRAETPARIRVVLEIFMNSRPTRVDFNYKKKKTPLVLGKQLTVDCADEHKMFDEHPKSVI